MHSLEQPSAEVNSPQILQGGGGWGGNRSPPAPRCSGLPVRIVGLVGCLGDTPASLSLPVGSATDALSAFVGLVCGTLVILSELAAGRYPYGVGDMEWVIWNGR